MPTQPRVKSRQITQNDSRSITALQAWIVVAVCLAILVLLYYSPMPLVLSVVLALADLVICGEILSRLRSAQRLSYGVYMVRSKLGLELMDGLSKKGVWFWNGLADWGLVLGFGLISLIIFRKSVSRRMVAFGAVSILIILAFVLPNAIFGLNFVNIPQITSRIQSVGSTGASVPQGPNYFEYFLYAISVIGGFVTYVVFSLAYNAADILYQISIALISSLSSHPNYSGLGQSIPGVAPIIPGITIPLFAGILALAVLLAVHEFSHGVQARIGKIKVKYSGALLFGIIPIGAFVEPDEKSINKLGVGQQNRISAAGVASNMLLTIIFLFPMLIFALYIMPSFQHSYVYIQATVPGAPAYKVITPGSVVLMWNGYNITSVSDFETAAKGDHPYSNISIVTNKGSYLITANSTGKVGVIVQNGVMTTGGVVGSVASFFYEFFALSFLLNFLVAVVNYLPIPSFDGWRIFKSSIKNSRLVFAITAFVVATLVINVLPWIWLI